MRHLETLRLIEAAARAGSIRKAADDMNITASALVRRINRFEQEFGSEVFERLLSGVRLNPAGQLVLHHYRAMQSDLSRVRSQVANLAGERRGHVSIACSQALLPHFLPREIAQYRAGHPGLTFAVKVRDRPQAEQELASFASDLALVFEPVCLVDFQIIASIPQRVHAVMRADHPLAAKPEAGVAITELSTYLQGQLVAVHPAYDAAFDGFAPPLPCAAMRAPARPGRCGR